MQRYLAEQDQYRRFLVVDQEDGRTKSQRAIGGQSPASYIAVADGRSPNTGHRNGIPMNLPGQQKGEFTHSTNTLRGMLT
ncbi:hypothetical protein MMC13_004314 [Lambiella insularis]|nr:hypothetical protein [Lambiella insularis]